jgi:hypothetical protein
MLNIGNLMSKRTMKSTIRDAKTRGRARGSTVIRDARTGELRAREGRVEAVMAAAERSGLLADKGSRIAGRVSPTLVEEAKRRTGIKADTDLIAFALANVALEDNFANAFDQANGKVDADLKLGY